MKYLPIIAPVVITASLLCGCVTSDTLTQGQIEQLDARYYKIHKPVKSQGAEPWATKRDMGVGGGSALATFALTVAGAWLRMRSMSRRLAEERGLNP